MLLLPFKLNVFSLIFVLMLWLFFNYWFPRDFSFRLATYASPFSCVAAEGFPVACESFSLARKLVTCSNNGHPDESQARTYDHVTQDFSLVSSSHELRGRSPGPCHDCRFLACPLALRIPHQRTTTCCML